MKVSPMFVVWQNKKLHVVTDHSQSRINDNIPCSEAKVKYNDIRTFSLLCWLGIKKLGIDGPHIYMDDFFSWGYIDNLIWYHDNCVLTIKFGCCCSGKQLPVLLKITSKNMDKPLK